MKRHLLLIFGVAACFLAYGGVYYASTKPARALEKRPQAELYWLKQEFSLNESEFKRISDLHAGYLPKCREMCARIDAKNAELRQFLDMSTNVTTDVQSALNESARLRAQCQAQMLDHFFEVSRTMSPEQGKRYLNWVRSRTLQGNWGMNHGDEEQQHGSH